MPYASSHYRQPFERGKSTAVAQPQLDRVVADIAVATEDLESVVGGLEHHGGGVVLRQAGLTGGLRSSVDLPRGLPGQQPGRVNLNRHLGQHEGNRLLLGDGGAERAPLFSVVASVLEGSTCYADGERRQGHARAIQQESEVTCQPRRGRYAAVVQGQLIR